jgi:hypothetical protein
MGHFSAIYAWFSLCLLFLGMWFYWFVSGLSFLAVQRFNNIFLKFQHHTPFLLPKLERVLNKKAPLKRGQEFLTSQTLHRDQVSLLEKGKKNKVSSTVVFRDVVWKACF